MNEFSNPASEAASSADRYVSALLDTLGDRDPREVLLATPGIVRTLATSVTDEQLRRPEREGKWSILQVLEHLADGELIMASRMRFAVAADGGPVVPYDQDVWVARLWKNPPLEHVLLQFEAMRRINLWFIDSLTAEEWQRSVSHGERGSETVQRMVALTAAHDLVHRRQLERIREAVR